LIALAGSVLERDSLVLSGRAVIRDAAQALGDTFFLVGARGGELRVLDKAEGNGVLRASPQLGSFVPMHATAVGKLYLALAPDEIAHSSRWKRFTPRTKLDRKAVLSQAQKAAARGYATNREEWIAGVSVIAAPIRLGTRLLGGVCAALPSVRFEQVAEREVARRVVAAARNIEQRMQGSLGAIGAAP
jgi:IclR family acetate operon transcriptional repressor